MLVWHYFVFCQHTIKTLMYAYKILTNYVFQSLVRCLLLGQSFPKVTLKNQIQSFQITIRDFLREIIQEFLWKLISEQKCYSPSLMPVFGVHQGGQYILETAVKQSRTQYFTRRVQKGMATQPPCSMARLFIVLRSHFDTLSSLSFH